MAFTAASSSGSEATSPAQFTVALSAASGQTVTVNYAVTSGTATGGGVDYTLASGTLTFTPGQTSKTIDAIIVNDIAVEPNETLQVTLSGASNATLGAIIAHTYTIQDNDLPSVAFTASNQTRGENQAPFTIAVQLSAAIGQTVLVPFTLSGTAGNGVDFTISPTSLTFIPGELQKNITVTMIDDSLADPNETIVVTLGNPTNATRGAVTVHTATITDDDIPAVTPFIVTSPDAGAEPLIKVFEIIGGVAEEKTRFHAYAPSFRGGVRVAVGDVNGDLVPDIITGIGPGGGPNIKVFNGNFQKGEVPTELASFYAYAPQFTVGMFVATADMNGDGKAEIITGVDSGGGPHVKIFNGAFTPGQAPPELASFFAYAPLVSSGVRVATGDVNGDDQPDIVTGTGPGGSAHVKVFSGNFTAGQAPPELASFFAYTTSFRGGMYVTADDINGDGKDDIITGLGPGGGPHVRAMDATKLHMAIPSGPDAGLLRDEANLSSFYAYAATFGGGVRAGTVDVNLDGTADIIIGPAPGGGPHVRVRDPITLQDFVSFYAYEPGMTSGIFVAGFPKAVG